MGLPEFLTELFEQGRVRVAAPTETAFVEDSHAVDRLLIEWDSSQRSNFPGEAPPFSIDVARWAADQFHLACQFAVFRNAGAEQIAARLNEPAPAAVAAAQHYAVDLVFRFLPDLFRLAHTASADDPLCERLRQWANDWPLSSVGMDCANPADVTPVCEHPGLLRLYVDRIIACGDSSRLADRRVRTAIQAALGQFAELAPKLAEAFQEPQALNN